MSKKEQIIEEIFNLSKKKNCKIIYPVDVSVSKKIDGKANIKKIAEVQKDDLILDIGPETLKIISKTIEGSKTVLWNGPAGYFENEKTKLMCLSGVKQYPMRVKCATLSWHTLKSAMEGKKEEINTEKMDT